MRLLITGATGDLGRELCKQAAIWGYEVTATYRSRRGRLQNIPLDHAFPVDLTDREAVAALMARSQPDVILHTAMIAGTPNTYDALLAMTHNLIEFGQSARLVNVSTDMVFDGSAAPYRDDVPPAPPEKLGSDYARGKAEAERILAKYPQVLTLRTSLIYDFDRNNKQVMWMVNKIDVGEKVRLFDDEVRSAIWVRNLAEAILELAEGQKTGILNLAGPEPISRLTLGCGLLRALGYDPDTTTEAISSADTGRAANLTLDVSLAQSLLSTRLLTFTEALTQR
jgi:dTDP-4-dehydrorhamnose reductase